MPIFERRPLETLTPAKDRWIPIYLEYTQIEVDDASIKWIGSDDWFFRYQTMPVRMSIHFMASPSKTKRPWKVVSSISSGSQWRSSSHIRG